MTVDEIMHEIEKDTLFYDESNGGVTFSGGEPLMQPDFLVALLKKCRERSIHTAVDTMGYADPDILLEIAEDVDLFLYDLKHMDLERHTELVGVSNTMILTNLRLLTERGSKVTIRIPVIPGINDDRKHIEGMAQFIASLPALTGVSLLPYHDTAIEKYRRFGMAYRLVEIKNPSTESMKGVAKLFGKYGLDVTIGG